MNEYLFEWILVGNLLLPLFIYFMTVDWLKYVQMKLLFHAVPPCLFAWQKLDDYIFCCLLLYDFALHIREATDSHRVTLYIQMIAFQPSWLSISQSVTLWASQLISQEQDSQSVNHSVVLSTSQSVGQSAIQSVALLASLSDSLLLCWSVSQAVSCHSASQSICQLVRPQSICQWV